VLVPSGVFPLLTVEWIADYDSITYEENRARKKSPMRFIDHITEICSMAGGSSILAMRFINCGEVKKLDQEAARIPGSPQLWWCDKDRNRAQKEDSG